MEPITWPLARLGSRFGLLFEPHHRRVMHSALGRFLDEPLDLGVGLIEPDGTERVFPLTEHGRPFYACQQAERINSITFRGYSETMGLRVELNVHSPFYPQNEMLCLVPAFYVELRVTWTKKIRWIWSQKDQPSENQAKLFLRLSRPNTTINVTAGQIDLNYQVPLDPQYQRLGYEAPPEAGQPSQAPRSVDVAERIVSLNPDAQPFEDAHGRGLSLDLPITSEGSGVKWRMIWAAHVAEPIMEVDHKPARFQYVKHWADLDQVVDFALTSRDDNLALSRRFEKLLEQAPLTRSRWHLLVLGFQSYLSNTFWCELEDGSPWFSVWEGSCMFHSTVDVEYNVSLLYFALWPDLLRMTMDQWTRHGKSHEPSGGLILSHDMGRGLPANGQSYPHDMPVEENSNFLLLLQAYAHWTADVDPVIEHLSFVERLADYLVWTDTDDSGFASAGGANTIDDAAPAVQYARKQTYLAIKRVAALAAAADLMTIAGQSEKAKRYQQVADQARPKIDQAAWLADHYAVCVDKEAAGLVDVWTGKPLPYEVLPGWDDYSIYTTNGLLLPVLINQGHGFDEQRLCQDLANATRETLTPYGCGHSSSDTTNIWISQNLWRDMVARYMNADVPPLDGCYWDLETFSNTNDQSFGFIDTYIGNELCFYPRGATAFGYFLAGPRLRIDRLAKGGPTIHIRPQQHHHVRWPLLPLADWKAGKIPVCVVDRDGGVRIEGELETVRIEASGISEEPEA